jgi:hypothetical protein
MFSILLSTICLPPPLGDQACRPRLSYDGQSHYCMLLPKKLQNKGPLLRDMPYVTAFCITFSNRGLGVPNSCCLCLGLAMHGIEVLTSDVRLMGWPLPPSAYLPDHLSVNTLHTYRTDHRPLAITSCEKTAPRPLIRESEDGSLLHCKLLAADNQKTADSPSSSRGVLPHSSELKLLANGAEPRTNRPTDRTREQSCREAMCVLFVRPHPTLVIWNGNSLCFAEVGEKESIGMKACPSTYYPIDASGHPDLRKRTSCCCSQQTVLLYVGIKDIESPASISTPCGLSKKRSVDVVH